jgi:DNA-binding transcriptional regulator YiaG
VNHQTRAFHGRGPNGETIADRLLRKSVLVKSGCREWSGWRENGYGRVAVERTMRAAHVVAWEQANGRKVPDGMVVRHRCDNPPCIEPSHLVIGTQTQNVADMFDRGRCDRAGENNNSAKLTAESVQAIRAKHAVGQSVSSLSREYGISESQVKNIVTRKQWKEVS